MLYGTLEGRIGLEYNKYTDEIKLTSDVNGKCLFELSLEDDYYKDKKQLAQELLAMSMKIIYDLEDENAMIEAIQSELTDNYDTSNKEYRIEVK